VGFYHHKAPVKPNGGTHRHLTFAFTGAHAPGPLPPRYSSIHMILSRNLIREFISKVEWATASNVCYLLTGKREPKTYGMVAAELNRMCKTKRKEIRLKKLLHDFYTCYGLADNSRSTVNHQHVEHDIKLRNCLGKYLNTCGFGLMEFLSLKTYADAVLTLNTGNLYFEFDSGHMGRKQLAEKMRTHYAGKGTFRVIFWMGTAEYAHWKNEARIKTLEQKRLRMLFEIVKAELGNKPNRVLGATYHGFLKDKRVFTCKEKKG
jgi:hypothetical protein